MPQHAQGHLPDAETLYQMVVTAPRFLLDLAVNPPRWENIPQDLQRVLARGGELCGDLSSELREAMDQFLLHKDPSPSLEWLKNTGILEKLLPELHDTVNLSDESERRHKHVWGHTMQVVAQAPPSLVLRYAALFHDIGKVKTRQFVEGGKVTFYAHDIVGAGMFKSVAKRLSLPRDLAREVYLLIKYHLRPGQYERTWTDSAVRRMGKEIGETLWDNLLALGRADITSKRQGKRESAIARIDELERRLHEIRELDAVIPPLPKGLGNLIIEHTGIKPGPVLGRIIKWLEAEIAAEQILAHQEGEYYLQFLHKCPHLPEQ